MTTDEDPQREKIFELNQEIIYLKGQITYLQEELSSVEDDRDNRIDRYEKQIADLEQQLGNALFRSWRMKYITNQAQTVVVPWEDGMLEWLLENYPHSNYRIVEVPNITWP